MVFSCRIEYENGACLAKGLIGKSNGKKVKQIGTVVRAE